MVIEIDGITHEDPDVIKNDGEKQKYLENLGFTVIRYADGDVREEPEAMAQDINLLI